MFSLWNYCFSCILKINCSLCLLFGCCLQITRFCNLVLNPTVSGRMLIRSLCPITIDPYFGASLFDHCHFAGDSVRLWFAHVVRKLFHNVRASSTFQGWLGIDGATDQRAAAATSVDFDRLLIIIFFFRFVIFSRHHDSIGQFVCYNSSDTIEHVFVATKFIAPIRKHIKPIMCQRIQQHDHVFLDSSATAASACNYNVTNAKRNSWHTNAGHAKSSFDTGISVRLRDFGIQHDLFDCQHWQHIFCWSGTHSTNHSDAERPGTITFRRTFTFNIQFYFSA